MKIKNKNKSKKPFAITITLLLLVVVTFCAYLLIYKSKEDTSPPVNMPTVQESTGVKEVIGNSTDSSTDSESIKTPTKTPGKTPSQYENETVVDEPAYNNEQFRIPEEDM